MTYTFTVQVSNYILLHRVVYKHHCTLVAVNTWTDSLVNRYTIHMPYHFTVCKCWQWGCCIFIWYELRKLQSIKVPLYCIINGRKWKHMAASEHMRTFHIWDLATYISDATALLHQLHNSWHRYSKFYCVSGNMKSRQFYNYIDFIFYGKRNFI